MELTAKPLVGRSSSRWWVSSIGLLTVVYFSWNAGVALFRQMQLAECPAVRRVTLGSQADGLGYLLFVMLGGRRACARSERIPHDLCPTALCDLRPY